MSFSRFGKFQQKVDCTKLAY